MPFLERLRGREADWWGPDPGLVQRIHRARELLSRRRSSDPDARWRCCARWPRALSNKLNARAFAVRHGCRVPALLWQGRIPARAPLEALPIPYVVKPALGSHDFGVHAMAGGHDLLGGAALGPEDLRRRLVATSGRISPLPVLIEELVRDVDADDGAPPTLPRDYKIYTFGETVAAVEVVERRVECPAESRRAFYTPDWECIPGPFRPPEEYETAAFPRPRCLDEMLAAARRCGRTWDTFVRVDGYVTRRGFVFGEFSSVPSQGRHFTAHADRYFGAFWDRIFPDRV